jgi:7-cyano-7-deazaguanine synthase
MKSAVVLLSGGLDSATCLAWARREGFSTYALTVDYGQRHKIEVERAAELAQRLGALSHRVLTIDLTLFSGSALTDRNIAVPKSRSPQDIGSGVPVTYVPARNTVLLALAMGWGESLGARDLVIGVNAVDYSGYPDCRPEFLQAFEALASRATRVGGDGQGWHVHAPLLDCSKAEIIRHAVAWGVPYQSTISCYDPDESGGPCGECDACLLRSRGFLEAGVEDRAADANSSASPDAVAQRQSTRRVD